MTDRNKKMSKLTKIHFAVKSSQQTMIEQLSIDIRLFAQPQSVSCEKLLQNIFCNLAGLAWLDLKIGKANQLFPTSQTMKALRINGIKLTLQ